MIDAGSDLQARLSELRERRDAIDAEIARLEERLRGAAVADVTRLDRWAAEPSRGPRRSRTHPYIDPARALPPRPQSSTVELGVGAPLAPGPEPEEVADFDPGQLRGLTDDALDQLPYGLVVVDAEGTVLRYNDTESRMVGLPAERVVGLNFFRDVAPCTRVRAFEGRFREFARSASGYAVETFDFVFRFARETQHVTIYLTPGRVRGTINIAMLRRRAERRG